ncbi:MAG: hypothetical protein QNJ85_13815 [Gammaproteobacteria bacterium]|nr:hypothetical protein [Gammaproteobacteria bacterium]
MASQPTPDVSDADIERVIRRDFTPDQWSRASLLLDRYGSEAWHREIERVRLAALKLANGNLERLAREMENAVRDYRDTLGLAEYPGYLRRGGSGMGAAEEQQIIDADWQQYQQWLKA